MWHNRGIPIRKSGLPVETQKTDRSIYLLLALTTALWGSLYTANKVLLEAVPSFTLLCLRYLLSAAAVDRVFTPVAAVQHVADAVMQAQIVEAGNAQLQRLAGMKAQGCGPERTAGRGASCPSRCRSGPSCNNQRTSAGPPGFQDSVGRPTPAGCGPGATFP